MAVSYEEVKKIIERNASKPMTTTNYGRFRRLEGNRKLTAARAKKIQKSIEKIGYIPVPIVVNEKYEVVDGQGRLEALRNLGLRVHYIVVPGLGREECIAMNIGLDNWKLMDYIESYAEVGEISYIYLLGLLKEYSKTVPTDTIEAVCAGKFDYVPMNEIKAGEFSMTEEEYVYVRQILEWLSGFYDVFKRIKGSKKYYYTALSFCYKDPEIDNDRVKEKLEMRQADLIPTSTTQQALDEIEKVYNHKARTKAYIKTRYRECLENKFPWYNTRYGDRY